MNFSHRWYQRIIILLWIYCKLLSLSALGVSALLVASLSILGSLNTLNVSAGMTMDNKTGMPMIDNKETGEMMNPETGKMMGK